MSTLAERCAEYAYGVTYADLPAAVVTAAKACLVDTLGVAVAGSASGPAAAVRRSVEGLSSTGACTVLGRDARAGAAAAALANGTAAHALELDDTDSVGLCHPGAVVVPAALAAAEERHVTGADLLAAVVVGYELTVRLARWVNPRHRLRGFHTTGTVSTMGAAAAVARVRGLGVEQVMRSVAVAASFAGGLFEFTTDGSTVKRVHAGYAAMSGVLAAELAGNGITGPATALDGGNGFYRAFVGDGEMPEPPLLDPGDGYVIGEVGRKPHPCCRFCHNAIDAALQLHGHWRATASVRVRVSRLCAEQTGVRRPGSELERQFSTPYGVALALLRGRLRLADYVDEPDDEALCLAARVELEVDDALPVDDRTATVELRHAGGTESRTVETALGEPANPLPPARLTTKFEDLAGGVLGPERSAGLLRDLSRADELACACSIGARVHGEGKGCTGGR